MSADILLQHLQKVKRTKPGNWLASCPSHQDKTASLSVRELDDGRTLIHCFAGCSVEEVLGAAGLTFDALYPEKAIQHGKPVRRPFSAADVLKIVQFETRLVYLCALDVGNGKKLTESENARLDLAAKRLNHAVEVANGY